MAAAPSSLRGVARWSFWRLPLTVWLVSRVLGALSLLVASTPNGRVVNAFGLTTMDGNWYRIIINLGYPNWSNPDVGSAWPFFPLYPWLADMLTRLGAPVGPSMILVSWLAALLALGGVYQLVRSRFEQRAAVLSVWLVALLPGSIGLVLSYSDSLFLAGQVWALVIIDVIWRRRTAGAVVSRWAWWGVGAATAIATASRPNGFMLVVVAWVAVWCVDRRWRAAVAAALPSAAFLLAWMIYGQRKVGDPLVFLSSKGAWIEWPLWKFVTDPFARDAVPFHVAVAVIVLTVAAPSLRRLPSWWLCCIALLVLPQLLLGVEGLARYVTLAAPLPVAAALTLSRQPVWVQRTALVVSAVGLMVLGHAVVRYSWVP
jgi:hypothetical protein